MHDRYLPDVESQACPCGSTVPAKVIRVEDLEISRIDHRGGCSMSISSIGGPLQPQHLATIERLWNALEPALTGS